MKVLKYICLFILVMLALVFLLPVLGLLKLIF